MGAWLILKEEGAGWVPRDHCQVFGFRPLWSQIYVFYWNQAEPYNNPHPLYVPCSLFVEKPKFPGLLGS